MSKTWKAKKSRFDDEEYAAKRDLRERKNINKRNRQKRKREFGEDEEDKPEYPPKRYLY